MNRLRAALAIALAGVLPLCAQKPVKHSSDGQEGSTASQDAASLLAVRAAPPRPWIEERDGQQLVNFDLLLVNGSSTRYRLVGIKLQVLDAAGRIEVERELNENGHPPALNVVGERLLAPGAVLDLDQPFTSFAEYVDLSTMHYELLFMRDGYDSPPAAFSADVVLTIDVKPQRYRPEAYCLPLQGRVLVHDGHDLFSHHRRFDLAKRYKVSPVAAVSANLYAYDFMTADEQGQLFAGSPLVKEHWLSYGKPVVAPTSGAVMASVSEIEENSFSASGQPQLPPGAEQKDPNGFGNYVTIQAPDGRVSWLLHMQPDLLRVRTGDHVKAGQVLGKVGFSGDSLFPHLHFDVTDGESYPSQGVPSYFRNFDRLVGSRTLHEQTGQVDSGDLVKAGPCTP